MNLGPKAAQTHVLCIIPAQASPAVQAFSVITGIGVFPAASTVQLLWGLTGGEQFASTRVQITNLWHEAAWSNWRRHKSRVLITLWIFDRWYVGGRHAKHSTYVQSRHRGRRTKQGENTMHAIEGVQLQEYASDQGVKCRKSVPFVSSKSFRAWYPRTLLLKIFI